MPSLAAGCPCGAEDMTPPSPPLGAYGNVAVGLHMKTSSSDSRLAAEELKRAISELR